MGGNAGVGETVMQDKENKILIICPSMWPQMNSWGETQRMYYLANYLSLHGWKAYVVAPGFKGKREINEREKNYESYFLGIYKKVDIFPGGQDSKYKNIYEYIRRLAASFLIPLIDWIYNEPDSLQGMYKQLWIWKYQKEIDRLIIQLEVETVIISVPAFVLAKLGKRIRKKFPGIKIIFDYRDAWHLWNRKKNLAYLREKRYLSYVDQVIGFSDAFSREMTQVMKIPAEKIATIYNGFSEEDWSRFERGFSYNAKRSEKLRLTFTGNMTLLDRKDNFRNPCKLIEALDAYDEVEMYFVGIKDSRIGTMEKNVHYIGNVSQQESFEYMKKSDVLISIHTAQDDSGKYIISGKFYDYMRSGKVIWHIGSSKDLMTKMVQEYKLGIWCENESEKLKEVIDNLLRCWKEERLQEMRAHNLKEIDIFSRENQNKKYADILSQK